MNRRKFVKSALGASAAVFAMPAFGRNVMSNSPNSRLNLAFIGCGNIADMAFQALRGHSWVALCDVDETFIAKAREEYPEAKDARAFRDFRVMFDKMGNEIDAVVVSTPDHTHFVATMWAMENGNHVCTQKPLARTVWETRTLHKAAKDKGVITNMANQGHTYDGIRKAREWLEHGLIGKVREVHSWEGGPTWGNGWFAKPATLPLPVEPVPETLEWDLWLGPRDMRDYSSYFHPKTWRAFWEFGTGMLGDWFCHTCDGPVWALDLYEPVSVELITKGGDNGEPVIPDRSVVKWSFPRRGGLPACELFWHDGGLRPATPDNWTFGEVPGRGSFFFGDQNTLFLDERSNNPRLVNKEEMVEFSKSGYPEEKYPRVPSKDPFQEWVAAIRGEGPTPGSNFDYASKLTEVALLGVIAQRFGGKIEWNSKAGKITNRPELNAYLREPVRPGWEIGSDYSIRRS